MKPKRATGNDDDAPWYDPDDVQLYSTRPPPGDVHSASTTVAAVPDAILDGLKDPIVHSPSPVPPLALPPSKVAQDVASTLDGWQDLAPPILTFDEPLELDDFERLESGMLALPTIDVDVPLGELELAPALPERPSAWRIARDIAKSAVLAIVLFAAAMALFWQLARFYG